MAAKTLRHLSCEQRKNLQNKNLLFPFWLGSMRLSPLKWVVHEAAPNRTACQRRQDTRIADPNKNTSKYSRVNTRATCTNFERLKFP